MRLSEILQIPLEKDVEISSLADRLDMVKDGCLFFAKKGENFDATLHIDRAVLLGAVAIVSEIKTDCSAVLVTVHDIARAEAVAAANFYGTANSAIKFVGITGTNGKTTVAAMLFSIIRSFGIKAALTGTVENRINDEVFESEYTTPTPISFHRFVSDAQKAGCEYLISEVSSHALKQQRLYGITFEVGIFTNISPEHSDYHPTFEDYLSAKLSLFSMSKKTLANADCAAGRRFWEYPDVKTYSLESKNADYYCEKAVFSPQGIAATVNFNNTSNPLTLGVLGKYNLSNSLAAIAAADLLGFPYSDALSRFSGVKGRGEIIENGFGINIIIDFAHTPDALLNILKTLRETFGGRIITVFGCGGDRDRAKRPEMGKIATENSDFAVITSDNPRSEEPEAIIDEIVRGICKKNYAIEPNRYRAVRRALFAARAGDTVLISGKGHEKKQIVSNRTVILSDRDIISDVLKEMKYED